MLISEQLKNEQKGWWKWKKRKIDLAGNWVILSNR